MDDVSRLRELENLNWRAVVPIAKDGAEKQEIFLPFSGANAEWVKVRREGPGIVERLGKNVSIFIMHIAASRMY